MSQCHSAIHCWFYKLFTNNLYLYSFMMKRIWWRAAIFDLIIGKSYFAKRIAFFDARLPCETVLHDPPGWVALRSAHVCRGFRVSGLCLHHACDSDEVFRGNHRVCFIPSLPSWRKTSQLILCVIDDYSIHVFRAFPFQPCLKWTNCS